jgi:hypothetical protein
MRPCKGEAGNLIKSHTQEPALVEIKYFSPTPRRAICCFSRWVVRLHYARTMKCAAIRDYAAKNELTTK